MDVTIHKVSTCTIPSDVPKHSNPKAIKTTKLFLVYYYYFCGLNQPF